MKRLLHAKLKVTLWFVAISLFVFSNMAITSTEPTIPAEDEIQSQKSLFLVGNEDALVADRITALQKLIESPSQESREIIFKILTKRHKTQAAKKFHVHLRKEVEKQKDVGLIDLFENKFLDRNLSNYEREIALTVLWNMDTKRAVSIAEKIVPNILENQTVRSVAMNHLMSLNDSTKILAIAKEIFHNPREGIKIRLAALKSMEDHLDPEELEKEYLAIVTNSKESLIIRTNVILKAATFGLSELEVILLKIVKDSKEDLEIRRSALQALCNFYESSGNVSLELNKQARLEKNSEFRSDLESAIKQLNSAKPGS